MKKDFIGQENITPPSPSYLKRGLIPPLKIRGG